MTPKLLETPVLVDDEAASGEYLAQFLFARAVAVTWFADSDDLLCSARAFSFDVDILDLLPGIDGVSLLRLLRQRTQAGMLVVSGKLALDAFDQVIGAGADMQLAKPVSFEQVALRDGSWRSAFSACQPSTHMSQRCLAT